MGQSASQAHAFYSDVAKNKTIWALCDSGGYASATNSSGQKTMGFWSSLSRVKKTKKNFEAYSSLEPDEISWENFRTKWLPGLKKDGYLVGLNWSGANVVGYDCEPDWVLKAIELQIQAQSNA